MLGPVMSASRMPTWFPSRRSATASSPLTNDLPTPPLPLITAITRRISLRCSALPFCPWGTPRPIRRFSSSVISVSSTSTLLTPSRAPTAAFTSPTIWLLSGQPSVVKARVMSTRFPLARTSRTIPSSMRLLCSSGSMTSWSAARTSASVGIQSPFPYRSEMGTRHSWISMCVSYVSRKWCKTRSVSRRSSTHQAR